ncbi:MAG: Transcription initiation factor TFIID subunit 12 [Phylliscum demangeonii]|nr:MAG: Transcription initiation factor TFIID subunit 12 [Phylliscum demangeonii]
MASQPAAAPPAMVGTALLLEQIRGLPNLNEKQKAQCEALVREAQDVLQKHPVESAEYQQAWKKLNGVSTNLRDAYNMYMAANAGAGQQAHGAGPGQRTVGPPPARGAPGVAQAAPTAAGAGARPGPAAAFGALAAPGAGAGPGQANAGPAVPGLPSSATPAPQLSVILAHLQQFPYVLPPELDASTDEGQKWLDEAKARYGQAMHNAKAAKDRLHAQQAKLHHLKTAGRELSPKDSDDLNQDRTTLHRAYQDAKRYIDQFRGEQVRYHQARSLAGRAPPGPPGPSGQVLAGDGGGVSGNAAAAAAAAEDDGEGVAGTAAAVAGARGQLSSTSGELESPQQRWMQAALPAGPRSISLAAAASDAVMEGMPQPTDVVGSSISAGPNVPGTGAGTGTGTGTGTQEASSQANSDTLTSGGPSRQVPTSTSTSAAGVGANNNNINNNTNHTNATNINNTNANANANANAMPRYPTAHDSPRPQPPGQLSAMPSSGTPTTTSHPHPHPLLHPDRPQSLTHQAALNQAARSYQTPPSTTSHSFAAGGTQAHGAHAHAPAALLTTSTTTTTIAGGSGGGISGSGGNNNNGNGGADPSSSSIGSHKMPIPKYITSASPPLAVNMNLGGSRPSYTGGASNPSQGMLGQPAVQKVAGFVLEGESEHVLSKKKLDELVRQVTHHGEGLGVGTGPLLTPDCEEVGGLRGFKVLAGWLADWLMRGDADKAVLQFADDFVDQVVTDACKLAKIRGSNTLELRDLQLVLERQYNIRVPGYALDEMRTVRKLAPAPGWTQKMAAVQAAKVTGGAKGGE